MTTEFDAIVASSGISGGWAAKELTEKGLKTLLIERGRDVEPGKDYPTEGLAPWEFPLRDRISKEELDRDYEIQKRSFIEADNVHFYVKDSEHPYSQPEDKFFGWVRGYHLGGRSLIWGRRCYRWSDLDFEANKKDGFGTGWPVRYKDIAPWYDHVETFAGISGSLEGLAHLPDGKFQPPMDFYCIEKVMKERIEAAFPGQHLIIGRAAHLTEPTQEQMDLGRSRCRYRNQCDRGCSFGAYFSSQSATLPAAKRTGNLTVVTHAIAHSVTYDAVSGRAAGVRVVDANTKEGREYRGRIVFLCASTLGSTQILLNSVSDAFANGIANGSGVLGHYLMDHSSQAGARGRMPGFLDKYYAGRRPNGIYIPRFRNLTDTHPGFLRGYSYQGRAGRDGWNRADGKTGHGAEFKNKLRQPGDWWFGIAGYGEMLPRQENHVRLEKTKVDKWGIPLLHISCEFSDNENNMLKDMAAAGGRNAGSRGSRSDQNLG